MSKKKLLRWPDAVKSALFCAVIGISASALAFLSPSSPNEAREGWIQLFDGETRFGWTTDGADWRIENRSLISNPSIESRLRTNASFSDFDLKFEARLGGPAVLVFRADPTSKPEQPGYRFSLNDGEISGVSGGDASSINSGWNSYELQADGEHLLATVNGKVVVDAKNGKNRVGYLEFAANHGSKVELRSIRLKPLGLDKMYNGSNLDGWKAVAMPPPQQASKRKLPIPGLSRKPKPPKNVTWTGARVIHGDGGKGRLESTNAYDDFVLQLAVKTEVPKKDEYPAAEVFFRGDAGQFNSGYAVNIAGGVGKASQEAKGFGTGGLVKLQPARLAAATGGSFFTETIIARGHRFCVWVNGLLVTDYYDSRPEGLYRSAAGPVGFRIENEDAKLDLSDVAIAVLAKGPHPPPPPSPAVAAVPAPVPSPPATGPAQGVSAAPPTMPTVMPVMPGQSPEEKARQEQVRRLTAEALAASTPEESVRINKQILLIEPGDVPAQQRLDKAQEKLEHASAEQERAERQQQESAAKIQTNKLRQEQLVHETQEMLIQGRPDEAKQRLNDAQRLGAAGSEINRLNSIIVSRLRDRLWMRLGLGSGLVVASTGLFIVLWRRRNRKVAPYLVAVDGVDKGKRYLLNQDVIHIGGVAMDSGKKNEILVHDPDRLVSRFHCEVHKRGDSFYLIDLNSSNGTFLHNKRLQPGVAVRLRDGNRMALANVVAFELQLERVRQ
jgi:hypothetical protein